MQGQYQCAKYCFDCRQFAFYTWGSSKHLIILILFGILNFIFGKFLQNTILAQKHFPHFTNPILHN